MSTIKPKLPPSNPEAGASPAAPLAQKPESEGEPEPLNHLAIMTGFGLFAEISHWGEQFSEIGGGLKQSSGEVKAIDPRNQVDPAKRFIPK